MDAEEFLAHHGIKGMKWGVVKANYNEIRNIPTETLSLKTSNGKQVTLVESKKFKSAAVIGAVMGAKYRQRIKDSRSFTVHADGKKVGEASVTHESKDELNLNWLGVTPSERGKGYASSVFEAGVHYAKEKGYSKITLEVPGNAPDARHIYEKFGFKVDVKKTAEMHEDGVADEDDSVWGGLTAMRYDIPKKGR